MDKNELVKKLKKDIQDVYSISDRFDDISQIHQIDIDLALSKVRNLYDLLLKLGSQANQKSKYDEGLLSISTKQADEDIHGEAIPDKVETDSEKIKEPEFIIETPKKEEKHDHDQEESIDLITKASIDNKQDKSSPEIIAEKFQSKRFVHDAISTNNSKKDVSSKLQSKPIKDINSAIGLNDKFIFIRELFKGDKGLYAETIQILNNFDSFDNALDFLNKNFDWDAEDPNYDRLKELVRRKYS